MQRIDNLECPYCHFKFFVDLKPGRNFRFHTKGGTELPMVGAFCPGCKSSGFIMNVE